MYAEPLWREVNCGSDEELVLMSSTEGLDLSLYHNFR